MEPPEHARAAAPGVSGDPLVGRLLERRYRIGARVARGGMASVYEATDIRLDRTVAVKIMHPGLGDDQEFAERFVREARAAARLNHPHVVGVYDQGDDTSDGQDTVFLVMEYVPGHTLRDVVRKEAPMPPRRALALLEPVVSALGAAHRAGLIHRDVKPENVLIADEAHGGRIKVADFGLAKAVSADTQHTATGGVLIGTVSYLAPELVVDGRADARADVYAAGRRALRAADRQEAARGRVADPGGLPPRPPRRADAVAPPARHPRLRRRARRPRHLARPRPAPRRRDGPAPPPPPRRAGAARGPGLRPRAGRRPAPPARAGRRRRRTRRARRGHHPRAVRRGRAGAAHRGRPPRLGARRRRQPGPDDRPRAPPGAAACPVRGAGDRADEGCRAGRRRGDRDAPAATTQAVRPAPGRTPGTAPGRAPSKVAPVATTARRRSRKGPVALLLALLLVAGIGAGAWWFGWERYTTTPGRARPRRGRGERRAGVVGPGGRGGRAGLQRERRRRAWSSPPTPSPAARSSTAAP